MRKMFAYIFLFLAPILLTSMFLRKAAGNDVFAGSHMIYEYLELYPVTDIEDVKNMFVNWKDVLFENAEFEPDWSGNLWEDIQAIGELIADAFMFLYNLVRWQILVSIDILELLWHSLTWILNLPYWVKNYGVD